LERQRIKQFIKFIPGINPTRAEKQYPHQDFIYYDQAAFELDFNHDNGIIEDDRTPAQNSLAVNKGDIIISNSLQMAAMVGEGNVGKIPSINFTKAEFISEELDKRYFIYLFNAHTDVARQKERELQGTGHIKRIPIKSLEQIKIPIIPSEEQWKIGRIYSETLKLQNRINQYAEQIGQFTTAVLERSIKEKIK